MFVLLEQSRSNANCGAIMQEEIHMALIVVQDMTSANMQVKRLTFQMASTAPVSALLNQVASSTSYVPDTFELGLQRASAETVSIRFHSFTSSIA